jgi:hypothetical protein
MTCKVKISEKGKKICKTSVTGEKKFKKNKKRLVSQK